MKAASLAADNHEGACSIDVCKHIHEGLRSQAQMDIGEEAALHIAVGQADNDCGPFVLTVGRVRQPCELCSVLHQVPLRLLWVRPRVRRM